jgi:hypothetical protein
MPGRPLDVVGQFFVEDELHGDWFPLEKAKPDIYKLR